LVKALPRPIAERSVRRETAAIERVIRILQTGDVSRFS
jgi:hypothetical protein